MKKRRLGILFSGGFFKETWITNKNIKNEIFLLKNILKNIFEKFSVNYKEISVDTDGFKHSIGYYDNNKRFAILGCVDDKISQDFDDKSIFYASIDIDYLNKKTHKIQ